MQNLVSLGLMARYREISKVFLMEAHVKVVTTELGPNLTILLSPLQKHVRKVVGGFGKKSFVSTGLRKPGNTYASPTAII